MSTDDEESLCIQVKFQPPESLFRLSNDVMQEGVIYLLVPPMEMLEEWVKDLPELSEEKKQEFLAYWDIAAEKLFEDEELKEISEHEDDGTEKFDNSEDDVLDKEDNRDIAEQLLPFIKSVTELTVNTVLYDLMPLFVTPDEENAKDVRILQMPPSETIMDAITNITPIKKAQNLEKEIEDVVFGMLSSVQTQLESDVAKQVIQSLNKMDDVDQENEDLKEMLVQKYNYQHKALQEATKRLTKRLIEKLDDVMAELCEYVQRGAYSRIHEMMVEDSNNIPGPQFLE